MEIREVGPIFVKLLDPEFSFLNHDRVADLVEVQLSTSVSDSPTLVFPVIFTCKGAAVVMQLMSWCMLLVGKPHSHDLYSFSIEALLVYYKPTISIACWTSKLKHIVVHG